VPRARADAPARFGAFVFRLTKRPFQPRLAVQQQSGGLSVCFYRDESVSGKTGSEKAFETVWATRESYLGKHGRICRVPPPEGSVADDHTLIRTPHFGRQGRIRGLDPSEEFRRAMPAPTTNRPKALLAIPSSRVLRSSRASAVERAV